MNDKPPVITQVEMTEADIELAEKAAARLGYTQTAYTSSSALWGLFCLRDSAKDRKPECCFIKTAEFGLLRVSDLGDLQLHDLAEEERKQGWQPKTGEPCTCRPGKERDNCPACEGTGMRIDFAAIRNRR